MASEQTEVSPTVEGLIEELFKEKEDSIDFSFEFKDEIIDPNNLKESWHRYKERKITATKSFKETQGGRFCLVSTYDPFRTDESVCGLYSFCLVDFKEKTVEKIYSYPWEGPCVPTLVKMQLQFDEEENPDLAGFLFLDARSRDFFGMRNFSSLDTWQDLLMVKL